MYNPPPAPDHVPPPPPAADEEDPATVVDLPVLGSVLTQLPSWLTSTVVHLVLLLLLATCSVLKSPSYGPGEGGNIAETGTYSSAGDDSGPLEDLPSQDRPIEPELSSDDLVTGPQANEASPAAASSISSSAFATPDIDVSLGGIGTHGDLGTAMGEGGDLLAGLGDSGFGLSLRKPTTAGSRARLVAIGGGTPASEAAVDKALKWLAEHQNADGSWSYDHRLCPKCKCRCKDPGQQGHAKVAATAMALLPYLGTGDKHHHAQVQEDDRSRTLLSWSVRRMSKGERRPACFEPEAGWGHGLRRSDSARLTV